MIPQQRRSPEARPDDPAQAAVYDAAWAEFWGLAVPALRKAEEKKRQAASPSD